MKLSLHISPCPNDTFIFHALLMGLCDGEGLEFSPQFSDISELNSEALRGEADVIKVSCAMLPRLLGDYYLLPCGGAMGYGNGPLLVGRQKIYREELGDVRVAVPGFGTTADLLLERTMGGCKEKREYLFSDISEVVMDGEMDAGVLIHEGRFTYQQMGLRLIADLGEEWELLTGLPIPLGVILVRRGLGEDVARRVARVVRGSVEFAFANPLASRGFVREHAQELEESVLERHISYFVNDFSVDMGEKGLGAIRALTGDEGIECLEL